MGDYLGEPGSIAVLRRVLAAFDFAGMPVDSALRRFLAVVQLPRLAQRIDSIMHLLAEAYLRCNADSPLGSTDTVFVLMFSCVMLNTEAHSDAIPAHKKMTLSMWLANNRGIGEGGSNVEEGALTACYERITRTPLEAEERRYLDPVREGWLSVSAGAKGGGPRNWHRRLLRSVGTRYYAVLSTCTLNLFRRPKDDECAAYLSLGSISSVHARVGQRVLELTPSGDAKGTPCLHTLRDGAAGGSGPRLTSRSKGSTVTVSCHDEADAAEWAHAIDTHLVDYGRGRRLEVARPSGTPTSTPARGRKTGTDAVEVDGARGIRLSLRRLDGRIASLLQRGCIRLISVSYLLTLEGGGARGGGVQGRMRRRQELEQVPGALLPAERAVAALIRADRSVFVLSYGWLGKGHPDRDGHRLTALVRFFQRMQSDGALPDDAGLFWEYVFPPLELELLGTAASAHAQMLTSRSMSCRSSFGSLPQNPRTPEEDATFGEALGAMADLYASPLGTVVIQNKEIPSRPSDLDGCVLLCALPPTSYDSDAELAELSERFSQFGEVVECVRHAPGELKLRLATHEAALRLVEQGADGLLPTGAWITLEYNERPYEQRGWV